MNAMYRFALPIAVRAVISSAGFVTSAPGGATFDGHGLVTLDTRYFEVGFGAGGMTTARPSTQLDPTTGRYVLTGGLASSFSFAQFIRVGAIDGLMAHVQTDVYVDNNMFQFGNMTGLFQIPLSRNWWLQVRGGGGVAGFAYGEAAVRHRLIGNGDHGSFFIAGSAGWAGVAASYGIFSGPSVGTSLEWRI